MIAVVMGVSGSGKSTLGLKLAARLNWTFYEGDGYHPPANLRKMASGHPLDDADRAPWLEILRELIDRCRAGKRNAVIACSALKESYRRRLSANGPITFLYLKGDKTLFVERLHGRKGHFMPAALLESQLEALEEPADAVILDAARTPAQLVDDARAALHLPAGPSGLS
jgi:gluconokinase